MKRLALPRILAAAMVTCLSLTAAAAARAAMIRIPVETLARQSDAIVRGRVASLESRWTADQTVIVTEVGIDVSATWAGRPRPGARFILQVAGGEVGEQGIAIEHAPRFELGEEVIVFVEPASGAQPAQVSGQEQGKFTVTGEWVVGFDHLPQPLPGFHARVQQAVQEVRP